MSLVRLATKTRSRGFKHWSNAEALVKAKWVSPEQHLSLARLDLARRVALIEGHLAIIGLIKQLQGPRTSWTALFEEEWESFVRHTSPEDQVKDVSFDELAD